VGTGMTHCGPTWNCKTKKQRLIEAETGPRDFAFRLEPLIEPGSAQAIELGDSLSFYDTPHRK